MSIHCIEANFRCAVYDRTKQLLKERGVEITGDVDRSIQAGVMDLDIGDASMYVGQFSDQGITVGITIESHAKNIVSNVYNPDGEIEVV